MNASASTSLRLPLRAVTSGTGGLSEARNLVARHISAGAARGKVGRAGNGLLPRRGDAQQESEPVEGIDQVVVLVPAVQDQIAGDDLAEDEADQGPLHGIY